MPSARPAAQHAAGGGLQIEAAGDHFRVRFSAMGGPCEVLVDTDDAGEAHAAAQTAAREAARIEAKFSRYRSDNIIHRINHAAGRPVELDDETAALIDYAATCWEMSGGMFDVTSGALRRVWTFDGGDRVPAPAAIRRVLEHVGWQRVRWERPVLAMPRGMEIDLGGIGKEYAVDRAATLLAAQTRAPLIVNFGGDLFASGSRRGGRPWGVGVDDPRQTGLAAVYRIELTRGGLATSGDARRFVMVRGKRLGHILDPRSGWPVEDAPRAITVLAPSCLEAGTLSTLAYLRGPDAEKFLQEQGALHWIL